jgi:hypothetical protein
MFCRVEVVLMQKEENIGSFLWIVIESNNGCNPIIKRSSSVKLMSSGTKGECLFLLGRSWKVSLSSVFHVSELSKGF